MQRTRNLRHVLGLLMAICLLAGLLPVTAMASDSKTVVEYAFYTQVTAKLGLFKADGTTTEIDIGELAESEFIHGDLADDAVQGKIRSVKDQVLQYITNNRETISQQYGDFGTRIITTEGITDAYYSSDQEFDPEEVPDGILNINVNLVYQIDMLVLEKGAYQAIMPGTNGIRIRGEDAHYDYIYYGHLDGNPIKWRVLDDETNTGDPGLFLLADEALGTTGDQITFNSNSLNPAWQGSDAQQWCQNFYTNNFDPGEQAAVMPTIKTDGKFSVPSEIGGETYTYAASENILNGDEVFFLSAEEASNPLYGFTDLNDRIVMRGGEEVSWWLRSPSADTSNEFYRYAAAVRWDGVIMDYQVTMPFSEARPAFNLDANAILFTSGISENEDGKAGEVGQLNAIPEYFSLEHKLTLLDENRNFTVTEASASGRPGANITLRYTGAQTGDNEYVSVILSDAEGDPAYYGRIAQAANADGEISFAIPSGILPGEYTLNVFNEQYNGGYETDYASAFATVALTVEADGGEPVPDTTAPVLSNGSVSRGNENAATVRFTINEAGTYYYQVVESGAVKPDIDTNTGGKFCTAGEQTISLTLDGPGAKDIYIVAKDTANNVTAEPLKLTIPAYVSGQTEGDKRIMSGAAGIDGGQADNVYFGTYQQSSAGSAQPEGVENVDWMKSDAATKNSQGPYYHIEPIKWRVLESANNELFLFSDQNLDVFEYHKENEAATWEKSTMRSWLNGLNDNTGSGDSSIDYTGDNFIGTAFSEGEQGAIADTTVVNDDNQGWGADGGADTTDKIFLLSSSEADDGSYFYGDESRVATNTAYVAGGGKIGRSNMNGVGEAEGWWLRSPARNSSAVCVGPYGNTFSISVHNTYYTVRPAFNLDLTSVLFTSATVNGKSAGMQPVADYEENEWKVTLADNNATITGNIEGTTELTEGYTEAPVLTVNHTKLSDLAGYTNITAVLTNSEGQILCYGSINSNANATSSTITLPVGLAAGEYTLSVYGEDWNGDCKTDYATAMPISKTITVTDGTDIPEPEPDPDPTPSPGGSGGVSTYAITVEDSGNGEVESDRTRAARGDTVTLTVTPDEGYELDTLTVTDSKGEKLELTNKGGGKYTFKMPSGKVTVEADFVPEKAEKLPFTDVPENAWYYDAVAYAYKNEWMNGTTGTTFAPGITTSRAMIVTILHRIEGLPSIQESSAFLDVPLDAWYADAVDWAAEHGIVEGYSDTAFGPNDPITREQMAAILYRYAQYKGYDVSAKADLNKFTDADEISNYALEALQWANAEGLINGKGDGVLDPRGQASRAEAAAILTRFNEVVAE